MSSKKVRVAVIGAGNMGKNHLRNYAALDQAELVGVADINPKTQKLADSFGIPFFTNYLTMIDSVKPDAVSIVVPTPLHAEVARAVIERKIHCLLEKPIASTVSQADELISLATNQGIIFTVGHIEQYNPLVQKLKSMMVANKLGTVTSIVCKRVGGFPAVEPKTDVIIDLAVHDIAIIGYLLDKQPTKVQSHVSRTYHSSKIDSAEILLDYGGASGFVQANWLTPVKVRSIALTGSKGYVEGNYITQQLVYYEHNVQQLVDSNFSKFVSASGSPKKENITVDFQEPLAIQLDAFLANINGDHSVRLVDPRAARDALGLALEALNSAD